MNPRTPDALGSWSGLAKQASEQITQRTQEAITNYFSWLQDAMSASPWGNTDLNKKLISYATETVSATSAFTQQVSEAKNMDDVVKAQTAFYKAQANSFNERAKEIGEIYTKMVTATTKTPLGMST